MTSVPKILWASGDSYDMKMQLSQGRAAPKLLSAIKSYFMDRDPLTNSWEQEWGLCEMPPRGLKRRYKRPQGHLEHGKGRQEKARGPGSHFLLHVPSQEDMGLAELDWGREVVRQSPGSLRWAPSIGQGFWASLRSPPLCRVKWDLQCPKKHSS